MSTGFMINEKKQLEETRNSDWPLQPAALRVVAKIISYIFHPVFVPLYLVLFMVYVHPYLFAGVAPGDKRITVIRAALMFTFFPVVTVLLLKGLDFIKSIYLHSQKDRIIPLVACGIWYFWIWYVWRNLPEYPTPAIQLALSIWIASWIGLMVNIKMKISLHAISMGIMVTFILLLAFSQEINSGIYISIALFIAGLVCTARFIASDHIQREIYGGLAVGMISQLIAWWVEN